MNKKLDLSKLTPKEQQEIARLILENKRLKELEQKQRIKVNKLNKEIVKLQSETISKEEKIKQLNTRLDELMKILVKEKHLIDKYNLERYVSKADLPKRKGEVKSKRTNGLPSTVSKEKKAPGRKMGSKNFGDDFLEERSLENEPITLDIAKRLKEENPNIILEKIDEETSYLVKRMKAHVVVYKVIMPKYKDESGTFYQENLPTPVHHSMIDASLLSDSITMKYFLGVPEYRYAKWLKGEGLPFSQKTINNWALQSAKIIEPFYNYLKNLFTKPEMSVANINIDETWLDVIENKKMGRDKSYVFCYSAFTKHGKLPLFEYSSTREINNVEEVLTMYNATITVDGYTGYNSLRNKGIKIQRCMVHARREFANIVKTLSEDQYKDSAAYKVVNLIDKIFHYEKEMREKKLSFSEILEKRQSDEYEELIKELEDYIKSIIPEKDLPLDKAINYYNNMNGEQWTYLKDGHVTLDNNEAERQAKKFVIDRKNFLFSKSEKGAYASCILLTIIDLGYENNLDPRAYLELVLNNLNKQPFDELLPWSTFIKENINKVE
ncbi:MAG: IS66 family transposase [Bacilli bacterium]|nr:IS66 family transposase [Bacilli bacterium]